MDINVSAPILGKKYINISEQLLKLCPDRTK